MLRFVTLEGIVFFVKIVYLCYMITINTKQAIADMNKLYGMKDKKIVYAIAAKSFNSALSKGRKSAIIETKSRYNIGKRFQTKFIKVSRATDKLPIAMLLVNQVKLPLMAFDPIKTRAGVSVRIKSQRQQIKGAFFADMKSGHTGIFAKGQYKSREFRFRNKRKRKQGNDLEINELLTLSYKDMFAQGIVKIYNDQISNELSNQLNKRYAKYFRSGKY